MDVQDKNSDDNREGDKNHSEEEVFSYQWYDQWGRGDCFCNDEEEHGQRQQDGDAKRDFLPTVGRQVEDQHRQEGNEEAGDDHVDGVEKRQAADVQGICDICVDLLTTVVLNVMLVTWRVNNSPLATLPEVFEVDGWANQHQVYLGLVVGPGAKLHGAVLVVEGEVCDVDLAGALEYGRRDPSNIAIEAEQSLGFVINLEISHCTVKTDSWEDCMSTEVIKETTDIFIKQTQLRSKIVSSTCLTSVYPWNSLVIQNNIRLPYPVGRYPNELHTSKFFWVPFELIVIPNLWNKSEGHKFCFKKIFCKKEMRKKLIKTSKLGFVKKTYTWCRPYVRQIKHTFSSFRKTIKNNNWILKYLDKSTQKKRFQQVQYSAAKLKVRLNISVLELKWRIFTLNLGKSSPKLSSYQNDLI